MSLLLGIVLLSTIISNYNVEALGHSKLEMDYANRNYLRQLERELQWNGKEQLFFGTRVEEEGDCTVDILDGYQWAGMVSMTKPRTVTTQRCMENCDANGKCMGWSYKPTTEMCWEFSLIRGVVKVSDVKSGSCIGGSLKTKCTDIQNGAYFAQLEQVLNTTAAVKDCMYKCDKLNICFGWTYSKEKEQCLLYSAIDPSQLNKDLIIGSCLATQKRIRVADSIENFRRQSLGRHNEKRKEHCTSSLTLDDDLNKISQDLANKLAADDITPPVYEKTTRMQTVFFDKGDSALLGSTIVDCFYDEQKYYDWKQPDFVLTNHFPKLIWKSSKHMGIGRAFTSDNGTMFAVTTYDWYGDIAKSFKKNVHPKCQ